MKLLIVESGEYSDFIYQPLVFQDSFKIEDCLGFKDFVQPEGKKRYTINKSLEGWLTQEFGARNLEDGDTVTYIGSIDDPIHYGSWEPYGKPWE